MTPTWLYWPTAVQGGGEDVATGGIVTNFGGYRYHTFIDNGTFEVLETVSVDILVVGGGGSGGLIFAQAGSGGGGAGAFIEHTITLSPGIYNATVGAGGAGLSSFASGISGSSSSFINTTGTSISITAIGGGGGGFANNSGLNGGSGGGGGSGSVSPIGGTATTYTGTGIKYGNNGGTGFGSTTESVRAAGGGGGAGSVGGNAAENKGGNGGNGRTWLNGLTYAGGGGGSASALTGSIAVPGIGGSGGGGAGGKNGNAEPGRENTGSGGGGNSGTGTSGAGGSGIVIIRYVQPVSVAWEPVELSTLLAWYDAADPSTITESSSLINKWGDKSGHGYNLTSSGEALPTYTSNGLNGKSVITFNSTHWLQAKTASEWKFLHNGTPNTVFIVVQYIEVVRMAFMWTSPFSSTKKGWTLITNLTNQNVYSLVPGTATNWAILNQTSNNSLPVNESHIIAVGTDSDNTTFADRSIIWINGGSPQSNNTSNNDPATTNPDSPLTLGRTGESTTSGLKGFIAEVLIFDGILTTENREMVEGYLAHKWGLIGNLPNEHPYKTLPPNAP